MSKFIFFDLGNVLLEFDHQIAIDKMAAITNVEGARVQRVMFDSGLQIRYETGLVTCDEYRQTVCGQLGAKIEPSLFFHAVSDIFRVNTPIVPIVAQLAAVGHPIAVLSNTCKAHWEFVRERFRFLNHFFHERVLSYEQQSMKPDFRIYEQAIAKSNVEPADIFFMDDRIENVQGAKKMGIDAVHFTDTYQLANEIRGRGIQLNY